MAIIDENNFYLTNDPGNIYRLTVIREEGKEPEIQSKLIYQDKGKKIKRKMSIEISLKNLI